MNFAASRQKNEQFQSAGRGRQLMMNVRNAEKHLGEHGKLQTILKSSTWPI